MMCRLAGLDLAWMDEALIECVVIAAKQVMWRYNFAVNDRILLVAGICEKKL